MKDFFWSEERKITSTLLRPFLQLSGTREYMAFMAISEGYKNSSLRKMFIKIFLIKFKEALQKK